MVARTFSIHHVKHDLSDEYVMKTLYKLKNISGFKLHAIDGEIGHLVEILFDDQTWTIRYFVVSTSNWFSNEKVLVSPTFVNEVDEENKQLIINLSLEEIKNCPPLDSEKPVSMHYEEQYYRYFNWEPYWTNSPFFNVQPYLDEDYLDSDEQPEHPHLRSSNEISSYVIHASDGDIGEAKDFIIQEPEWLITYLEIDTHRWIPGKHVLISPNWVEDIDWKKQQVDINLSCKMIDTAPEYDPTIPITLGDEQNLYLHYSEQ